MGKNLVETTQTDQTKPDMSLETLGRQFLERFGIPPRFFYAPGRVNLIGEHTDYNQGFVLPMAINRGTLVAGVARKDRRVLVHSLNEQETLEFDLNAGRAHPQGHWINYVEGVARSLEERGFTLKGANLLIISDVPTGAGLSSSAALENAVGYAMLSLAGYQEIDRVKLALAGQAAEHRYVGTQCGIMDQFVTALAQEQHALLIDCRSMEATSVPVNLPDTAIVICDSRVKHALASSAYNQRVAECKRGVEFLSQALPSIKSLRDVDIELLNRHQNLITDEIVVKRVRHVVTENERTLQAAEALHEGNSNRLGQLMFTSHESLKNDYEVSSTELDTLVEIARRAPGVKGARMTGGGFGGCTVNLVQQDQLESFRKQIVAEYREAFGIEPHVYVTGPSRGVRELAGFNSENSLKQQTRIPQAELNQILNERFDAAFRQGKVKALIGFADEQMPPLDTETNTTQAQTDLPQRIALNSGPVQLLVNRSFGIRLYYEGQEVTTDRENIPFDYPWFQPDPSDPEDIAGFAARHVARGSRGESPWPESQWPQIGGVRQGEQNWPHRDAAFGPYQLALIEEGDAKAVRLSLPDESKPNAYGVIPRGLFSLTSNVSVILALQHENRSPQGLHWSPWFVLGFAMPKEGTITNPSVIFAFPDADAPDALQDRMSKVWNYMEIAGQKMALINPHAKTLNEPFKKLYRDVNWSLVAEKGADHVILTRSILRHEEQYFPFLEHGKYFIEAEHTGPRVPPGEISTVIVKHDFVSLEMLTRGEIKTLSREKGEFERQVRSVLEILIQRQRDGALISNYSA